MPRVAALLAWLVVSQVGCGDAGAGHEPELRIRLALQPTPANKAWDAANLIRQGLEQRSNGRIEVLFYDSAVLGDERAILEACYLGVIEMVE